MPIPTLTKSAKTDGIQTYANVRRLPPELQEEELVYLDFRDAYLNMLAIREQLEERLAQEKRSGDYQAVEEVGKRLHRINSELQDMRKKAADAGERSYAEAFMACANIMLPPPLKKAIDEAAASLIGRGMHELSNKNHGKRKRKRGKK